MGDRDYKEYHGEGVFAWAKRKESVPGRVCTVGYEAQHLGVVVTAPKTNILLWD